MKDSSGRYSKDVMYQLRGPHLSKGELFHWKNIGTLVVLRQERHQDSNTYECLILKFEK